MATIIKSTAVVSDNGFSAIKNAVQAGLLCLERTDIPPQDVGLLINAGVYRDDNIMEPSIASLIQKELNMGLDFNAAAPHQSTLSFDVVNGACGFLNACAVADSFLKNGTVRYALIVCGDAHSSCTEHPEFPYVAVGAAALLEYSTKPEVGFQSFFYNSSNNDTESNATTYGDLATFGDQGRSGGSFILSDTRVEQFRTLNINLINTVLNKNPNAKVDFVLGSDIESGFCNSICEQSQLAQQHTRAIDLHKLHQGDVHTAAPIAAFDQLLKEVRDLSGRTLMFSCVGSGDAAACALYKC